MSGSEGGFPPGIDPSRPSAARIYDYFLGGKDNFEADRAVAEHLLKLDPRTVEAVRENRRFLVRAVRHLVEDAGIRQFLDIGTGLPTQDNVHEVAARYAPDARVVYVDNDPLVLAHARALLAGGGATIVQGDLRRPDEILASAEVRQALDFTRPVAVLLVAVLHFVSDGEDPRGAIATLRDAVPSGSRIVITHGTADGPYARGEESAEAYRKADKALTLRRRDEIVPFFDGLDPMPPGLTWIQNWWPERPYEDGDLRGMYAGIGIKP
ncbi:SAM-dependent methyltransferase [Actinomadura rupiterrae]|uniref:SAM-dependent methyltransferase n=1 Tax=Actinomadura rupiterrae TaxID=559627 RepID=UPI0020A572E7|nr:SAM-dependent methyltransferase [Actinomadura rupiterrae]MCP2338238.1 SAM-dependent methyltransferase [Actinomadura rupiterrae]